MEIPKASWKIITITKSADQPNKHRQKLGAFSDLLHTAHSTNVQIFQKDFYIIFNHYPCPRWNQMSGMLILHDQVTCLNLLSIPTQLNPKRDLTKPHTDDTSWSWITPTETAWSKVLDLSFIWYFWKSHCAIQWKGTMVGNRINSILPI